MKIWPEHFVHLPSIQFDKSPHTGKNVMLCIESYLGVKKLEVGVKELAAKIEDETNNG